MPRFGFEDVSPLQGERFVSPLSSALTAFKSTTKSSLPSTRHLSCLSPDGRSVHILHNNCIETHALPLAGTSEDSVTVPVLSTPIPSWVEDSMELLCIEGDSMPRPEFRDETTKLIVLPLLCIYTRHSVFILKIGYIDDEYQENDIIAGELLEISQPFEKVLFPSSIIRRVRPAPHRRLGYALFVPPGSLAALVTISPGEDSVLLYHAKTRTFTQPLTFAGTEDVFGEPEFIDFSFAQSNALSLLVSLSIHLVKSNGEVWGASPIVFEGSMIPNSLFDECDDLLEEYSVETSDQAKEKQCRAAIYFLRETFEENINDYRVARIQTGNPNRSTLWPVQVQGPMCEGTSLGSTTTIEPFFARNLVGFILGGDGGVQLCVTLPTMIFPRFTFESQEHAYMINSQLTIHQVEHITDLPCFAFVRDPVIDTMIHCLSQRGVITLTSHSLRHFSSVMDQNELEPGPTKAWLTVELIDNISIQGAVVSGDAHLGHVLVVYLSTGQLTSVNLTEMRVRFESMQRNAKASPPGQMRDEALQTMESTPAFHEQLVPLMEKIEVGLSGMSKIVGTATHPKDLDAGLLATALAVQQRCEQDLLVHLKYLRQISALRHSQLKQVLKGQVTQLRTIQESLKEAKAKRNSIREQMAKLESKSRVLAERCSLSLQASKDLRPELTVADIQYLSLLKRLKAQCHDWEKQVENLIRCTKSLDSIGNYQHLKLIPPEERDVRTLLRCQRDQIVQSEERVQLSQELLTELMQQAILGVHQAQ